MTTFARRTSRFGVVLVLAVALVVVILDQITKWLAVSGLEGRPPVELVGEWLRLSFARNPGAAFSIGTQQTWIFAVVACVVSVGIVIAATRIQSIPWLLALGVLLGGALGNLVDRVMQPPGGGSGHVVDFIQLPSWPLFNVADMCVVTGAIALVALSILGVRPNPEAPPVEARKQTDSPSTPAEPAGADRGPG